MIGIDTFTAGFSLAGTSVMGSALIHYQLRLALDAGWTVIRLSTISILLQVNYLSSLLLEC
jgi:hypothetical protein